MAPIFVSILDAILYKHEITIKDGFFMLSCVLGISFITVSELLMNYFFKSESEIIIEKTEVHGLYKIFIQVTFMLSIIMYAYSILIVKEIKCSIFVLNVNCGIVYIFIGGILYYIRADLIGQHTFEGNLMLVLNMAIPFAIFHYLFNYGTIIVTDRGRFTLTSYTNVILTLVYDLIVFKRLPSIFEITGIIIVFYSLYRLLIK